MELFVRSKVQTSVNSAVTVYRPNPDKVLSALCVTSSSQINNGKIRHD